MICKHCGKSIRPYAAEYTSGCGWMHENREVYCRFRMAEPDREVGAPDPKGTP